MFFITPRLSRPALGLAAASVAAASTSVHADVAKAEFHSLIEWHYDLRHMPDLDQVRSGPDGLPGDGLMFCAPTAATNILGYAANHGFPLVPPGDFNFQSQANYDQATITIDMVGNVMGTTPEDGTSSLTSWRNGVFFPLAVGAPGKFTVSSFYVGNGYSPRLYELAQTACNGSLITFCYGRYTPVGTYDGVPLVDRTGGHCVTLNKTTRSTPFDQMLWFRDPATGGDSSETQSLFQSTQVPVGLIQVARAANDDNVFWMSNFDVVYNDGRFRIIDGYIAVRPKAGYSFTENGINTLNPAIDGPGQITTLPIPTHGNGVSDVLVHPDLNDYLVLHSGDEAGPALIFRMSPQTGSDEQVGSVFGGRKMVVGRCRELYILTDTSIEVHRQIDNSTQYELVSSIALPTEVDTIAFDDATDELLAISTVRGQVLRYPKMLPAGIAPTVADLPSGLPLSGCIAIAVSPDGVIWIASDGGGSTIVALEAEEDGTLTPTLVDVGAPVVDCCISVDDLGHPIVRTTNGLTEMEPDGNGGWMVADGDFSDFDVEGCFHVHRSRTNYDPAIHDGLEWANIPADELAMHPSVSDCDWDITGDGVVNVDDLLRLLAAWGSDDGLADLDGSGIVDVEDLLDLLAHWGNCPE